MGASLSLFSGLAVKDVLEQSVLPNFRRRYDVDISATYEPTSVLMSLIDDGARPDVMIGVSHRMDELAESGVLAADTVGLLLRSAIGVAVHPNGRVPNIGTVESLTAALIDARSVAYSRTGASGLYFTELLDRLQIAQQVNPNACILDGGFTAEALVDGRADIAVQQIVELASVPGVRIIGPLPDEVQRYIELSVGAGTSAPEQAQQLVHYLRSDDAMATFDTAGLQAVGQA